MMSMRTGHVDHMQLFNKNGLMPSMAIIMRGLQTSPPKSKNVLSTCFQTEKSCHLSYNSLTTIASKKTASLSQTCVAILE